MAKKAYIGVENFPKRSLPNGYTQVEYIESSGTQYIDTGYVYQIGDVVTLVCSPLSETGDQVFFGSRPAAASYQVASIYGGLWRFQYTMSSPYVVGQKYTIKLAADGYWYIDDVNTGIGGSAVTGANAYLFANNASETVEDGKRYCANARGWSFTVERGGLLIHDFVPCVNANNEVGMIDNANNEFHGNIGTGVFAAGETYFSAARKNKKGYIGVGDIARKIKKAYIGVGGVARPCWSSGELSYYGTISPMSVARHNFAATSIGKYALLGGAHSSKIIDVYDKSLTKTTAPELSVASLNHSAASVGNYALFTGDDKNGTVDVYDTSLIKTTASPLSLPRERMQSTSIGDYALFCGGYYYDAGTIYSDAVDAYNTFLVRSTPTKLSAVRSYGAATSVGDFALVGGGGNGGGVSVGNSVEVYNSSLTKCTSVELSVNMYACAATTLGNCALFSGASDSAIVDIFDEDLTKLTPTELSVARQGLAATSLERYALFGGGYNYDAGTIHNIDVVDAFNTFMVRSNPPKLNIGRYYLEAVTIGGYALFAGGSTPSVSGNTTVDVYTD